MELYIAGTLSRPYVYKKAMEVFLADEHAVKNGKDADWEGLNILETYYYLQNNKEFPRLIGNFQNFLLDSGAFTFMSGAGVVDFDKYVEGYAAFIKKWDVKNFFELDIDSVVGIKEVKRLREKLERLSGRKPIPVWHKSRGKEYFVEMYKNYPYVAIGGIVTKEIPINKYEKLFPWFVKTELEERLEIASSQLFTMNEKVTLMEKLLAQPMSKVREFQADATLPSFVRNLAQLLWNNQLPDYLDCLGNCRRMAAEDKEARKETSFI